MNKLVVTLVLYNEKLSETPSYDVLKKSIEKDKSAHFFCYDNSPCPQENELFKKKQVTYVHNKNNPGLATAYNAARQFAVEIQADLLLLLDQDTCIPSDYIDFLCQLRVRPEIGAYVPLVFSREKQLSPVFVNSNQNINEKFPIPKTYSKRLMAINSGTVLPLHILLAMNEFNPNFPLDYLDHWLFWFLYKQGKEIEVINYRLEHDLSVSNYDQVSQARYESIIQAERFFYTKYDQKNLKIYRRHMIARIAKQFLTVKNRVIWRRTLKEYLSLLKGK